MKKSFVLALLTIATFSFAQAQDATSPSASSTPAPTKAEKKAAKKKKKKHVTKEADAQKSNVLVPTGAGVGDGALIKTQGQPPVETVISNTSPSTSADSTVNPPKGGSIDDEITNKKMRAEHGSLSKYSIQTQLNYAGGSLHKPFAADRPSLSPGDINPQPVSLAATVAAKYRATEHDNINLGFGLNWVNPFHGNPPAAFKNSGYDHLEASDPYLAYVRLFKALGIQNVLNVQVGFYTDKVARDNDDKFSTVIEHTLLYGIGKSGVEVGLDYDWDHEFYGSFQGGVMDALEAYPFMEYEITKSLSFRTVYWGLRFYNVQGNAWTFHHKNVAQSAGVGISVTRDIYLYPNVQWNWDGDARWRKTNIALQANINAF